MIDNSFMQILSWIMFVMVSLGVLGGIAMLISTIIFYIKETKHKRRVKYGSR